MDTNTKPKTGILEFFSYFLIFITLITTVTAVINYLFDLINRAYPIGSAYSFGANYDESSIRWSVSLILVFGLVFVILSYLVNRYLAKHADRHENTMRRFFIFLTIFIASLAIIIDLGTLVFYFLGGDVSMRFLLKVFTVLIIGGVVDTFSIFDLKRDVVATKKKVDIQLGVLSVVLLGLIISGFVILGSPFLRQDVRLDERRLSDLQYIESLVTEYVSLTDKMPKDLAAISAEVNYASVPVDPKTMVAYTYTPKTGLSYELCAAFTLSSDDIIASGKSSYMDYTLPNTKWKHEAGNVCFPLTVNTKLLEANNPKGIPEPMYY